MTRPVCLAVLTLAIAPYVSQPSRAQSPAEYRVVFASAKMLARQLDDAGRDGYQCLMVAQPEPGAALQGVVAIVARAAGASGAIAHRVLASGRLGADLHASLDRAGAEGFRACGVVLDEEPPMPSVIAVMSRRSDPPPETVRYGVDVLTNYKDSLVRLNAKAREGFYPAAAAPVDNNRLPEMRSWLVVTEQTAGRTAPREIAVRSNSGADGLQRALNEQGTQGYRLDLLWKEGNDIVAMMSRAAAGPPEVHAYGVDVTSLAKIHSVSRIYKADAPWRPPDDRLVVTDRDVIATNDVEEDSLPALGRSGYVEPRALETIGDHISRHHGAAPAAVRVHRLPNGSYGMTTIVVQHQ